ncbi:hypothetical protein O5O45_26295 [Hahella aquimaris]|uniref:hypothetical protein n=1 Tax=Hahella sp. HNIBRBA332 TaxID=3015983 RepID=UPI00273C3310|nr:hypothetical protein [Hahella sp. HNIBRBA332]WLQ13245.1 hypothetical protein O5O45_26295 [Hahella sp. HNIBRBA332]
MKHLIKTAVILLLVIMISACQKTLVNQLKSGYSTTLAISSSEMTSVELEGRTFDFGSVKVDFKAQSSKANNFIPDKFYAALLEHQLLLATQRGLRVGVKPAYIFNVSIKEILFKSEPKIIPTLSYLRVELSILRPDLTEVIRTSMLLRDIVEPDNFAAQFLTAQEYSIIPEKGVYHAVLIPSTAIVITKVLIGLQQGKQLDEIVIDDGRPYMAERLLISNDFGLKPMTRYETEQIIGFSIYERD